ncbi:MAG: aminotransferase class I/II-fold pyridoxal phosphate-dependent enzyme [Deltaproteobacteria bacterium]|jgi:8-amino-7-oxononanoate synthase|nr:aminotransferase class I/II-fold pyridoxal phosphate-dependent enzyme [Syntrophaceae bacterium]
MKNNQPDISRLTPEEKRKLLEKMLLKGARSDAPKKDAGKGFQYPEDYRVLQERFKDLEKYGCGNIYFTAAEGLNDHLTTINGRTLINYTSYNYIGLSGNPVVAQAAKDAIDKYGTSVSASRLASGERPDHRALEQALAEMLGAEDCLVFVGGYGTNETVIGHLMNTGDLILFDSYSHASIQDGCRLSGADVKPFPHNNWEALDTILGEQRKKYRQVLIVIEGVYSMDGDIPDLPRFVAVKKNHEALLMIDEAHSIGVLGRTGAGIGEYHAVDRQDVEIWMGTLSKSFASCGGYIAGGAGLIEYLKYTAPGFVYSVGMSPPNTAAALAAVSLMRKEPERLALLHRRADLFLELCRKLGLNTGASRDSAVIPIITGDSVKSVLLYKMLFDAGIYALPIMYPVVPENASRLRFFLSSTHTEEEIRKTADILQDCCQKVLHTGAP